MLDSRNQRTEIGVEKVEVFYRAVSSPPETIPVGGTPTGKEISISIRFVYLYILFISIRIWFISIYIRSEYFNIYIKSIWMLTWYLYILNVAYYVLIVFIQIYNLSFCILNVAIYIYFFEKNNEMNG